MVRTTGPTREQLERASLESKCEDAARTLARLFSAKALSNMAYAIRRRASEAQQQAERLGFGSKDGDRAFLTAEELRLSGRIYDRARVLKDSPEGKALYDA
jgi:hypothetical protein